MKATRYPDGRIEFDGTPEEITTAISAASTAIRNIPLLPAHAPSITHLSQEARARTAIYNEPTRTFTVKEICRALGMTEANRTSIGTVLAKLARDGQIYRIGRGQYTSMPA